MTYQEYKEQNKVESGLDGAQWHGTCCGCTWLWVWSTASKARTNQSKCVEHPSVRKESSEGWPWGPRKEKHRHLSTDLSQIYNSGWEAKTWSWFWSMFNILWIIFLFTQMQALCAHKTRYRVLENPLKTYMCAFFWESQPAFLMLVTASFCIFNETKSSIAEFSFSLDLSGMFCDLTLSTFGASGKATYS